MGRAGHGSRLTAGGGHAGELAYFSQLFWTSAHQWIILNSSQNPPPQSASIVADHHRTYELRCPVHGFIPINDWEREIINQPAFQRLRRIRQLAWTDYVYPGAMHTRFEHSLGVMHIVSQLFDAVVRRSSDILKTELEYTQDELERDRQIVRLTALLHDTGHCPFSHAGEDIFPTDTKSKKHYKHEAYSAAIILNVLKEAIEGHKFNEKYAIKADEITDLLEGTSLAVGKRAFWRELIDGQMDGDRMDYLLRDSLHTGVDYGKYDWRRLVNTIQLIEMPPRDSEAALSRILYEMIAELPV
jgi:uncharacterized protein